MRTWYAEVSLDRDKYPDFSGLVELLGIFKDYRYGRIRIWICMTFSGSGSKKIERSDPDPKKVIRIRNTAFFCYTGIYVADRWGLQHDCALVPKSVNPSRQMENMDIWDFKLSAEEMKELDALDRTAKEGQNTMVGWLREHDPDHY